MLSPRTLLVVVGIALLQALAACGTDRLPATGATGQSGPAPLGLPALPAPSALLRHASGGGGGLRCGGIQTDPALAPQRTSAGAVNLTFSPAFPPGLADHTGLAYALYRFNATGFTGSETLRLGWTVNPPSGKAWAGLGSVASDRWVWRSLPVSNSLALPGGLAPYTAANGDVLVVILLTGSNSRDLTYVRLGNEPPHASLVAPATAGTVPLTVDFDAGSSYDHDGSIATYEIDFGEGAGYGPLVGTSVQHQYTVAGTYQALLRVTDDEGGQGTAQVQIDAGVVPNQPPTAVLDIPGGESMPGIGVALDASGSTDGDGAITQYEFDPEGDGSYLPGSSASAYGNIYTQPGDFNPTVRVTDDKGATATASQPLTISYGTLELKVLDGGSSSGGYCNIGTANGKLCVAYKQGATLAFVRATAASGNNWFAPQLFGSMGSGCSLAIIKGNPAIAYHPNGADELRYQRANDADGAAWASPFTIMSGITLLGTLPALATINGFPAVTCSDASGGASGTAWYCRATNDTGTMWGLKKQISAAGQTTACGSLLALASGNPCAGLVRTSGFNADQVQFVAATNATGTSWDPPIPLVSTEGYLGGSGGLALIGGVPALVYGDSTTGKYMYLRANDAAGLDWGAPVEIGPGVGAISLATVNGLPVVACKSSAPAWVLRIAKDTTGQAWNPPITFDPTALPGVANVSLTNFNGRPAIAYASGGSGLKLARWK